MNHSYMSCEARKHDPTSRRSRLGKVLSEDESSIARLENKWTTLLIDEARSWPGEKRPGWIPMAAVFMVLEQVYKDGITVGARSWLDDPEDDILSYGGTTND